MSESPGAEAQHSSLEVAQRVKDLLGRMTLAEKVAQLTSLWLNLDSETGDFAPFQAGFEDASLDPDSLLHEGLGQITRPFGTRPVDPVAGARALRAIQRRLVQDTRLGIPAIAHEESLTGFMAQGATQFPSPLNYGATWDPDLIERVGAVIRRQMRAVGTHQALAPVADVIRDARWGRVEECVSEDPYLVGCIVSAYVRGLQGDDLTTGVVATLKHFAGYSGSEGGRNFAPVHAGPREMADVFLLPFEMAVKDAGACSVMNGYHAIDGQPCASSHELLTGILRDQWGFEGVVVADYGAIGMLETLHHTVEGKAAASAAALTAGLDVELPSASYYPEGIPAALDSGLLDLSTVDRAVARDLKLKVELGLFEEDFEEPVSAAVALDLPAERALVREVAEKSITLLANDGILPLRRALARLAVIGPNADDAMALFGNYSFQNHVASHFSAESAAGVPTVLDAVRGKLPATTVTYARGCFILHADECRAVGNPVRIEGKVLSDDRSGFDEAIVVAREADAALLVLGDKAGHFRRGTVGEGTDTDDLSLPGVQRELAEAVLATGTPTIVILVSGRPLAIPELARDAAAIALAWFPGQEGASAIADMLFGDLNPGGKTTVTFSRSSGVQPAFYNHTPLGKGVPNLPAFEPVFPFGHGLSYTEFAYHDLQLSTLELLVDGELTISHRLTNIGERAGEEVVQLYVHDEQASIPRPVRELKGFARVRLAAGEGCRVTFRLSADMLSFTGPQYRRIVEPGTVKIMLGSSSADTRLEGRVTLVGATRTVPENRTLTTHTRISR